MPQAVIDLSSRLPKPSPAKCRQSCPIGTGNGTNDSRVVSLADYRAAARDVGGGYVPRAETMAQARRLLAVHLPPRPDTTGMSDTTAVLEMWKWSYDAAWVYHQIVGGGQVQGLVQ